MGDMYMQIPAATQPPPPPPGAGPAPPPPPAFNPGQPNQQTGTAASTPTGGPKSQISRAYGPAAPVSDSRVITVRETEYFKKRRAEMMLCLIFSAVISIIPLVLGLLIMLLLTKGPLFY